MEEPPSLMARKFLHSKGEDWEKNPNNDYTAFPKEYYFFYGHTDGPTILAKVLQLSTRPQLYPAKTVGYSCKLWGPYPALVDGSPGALVYSMAYEMQSSEEANRLQAHETYNFRPRGCRIRFEDGREFSGREFLGRDFSSGALTI